MIHRTQLGAGVSVVISTRATGRVRLAIEHEHADLSRADMDTLHALSIAQALIACGHAAAVVELKRNAGEGGHEVVSPQRIGQAGYICWPWLAILVTAYGMGWALVDVLQRLGVWPW